MKRIAFVTYKKQPKLNESDALVVPYLAKQGVSVEAVPWDDRGIDWTIYDAVILRSTWDYHLRYKEFTFWLSRLKSENINIWNNVDTLIWNIDKSYLLELVEKGVDIIPTMIIDVLNDMIISQIQKWDQIVIKPVHGGSAYNVKKFAASQKFLWISYINKLLCDGKVIIQEFQNEIFQGEYSLIFFNKKYSHAVIKIPKMNEFRSQIDYGGVETSIKVSPVIISQAEQVLQSLKEPFLYARVDGLIINDVFMLMELELAEPYLFLETDTDAPKKFSEVIETVVYR